MKHRLLLIAFASLLNADLVFAHGEDKFGPHGGFIRMPGAYHTELIADGKNKLKVYLLNMQWKNPSVTKTKLEITYKGKISAQAKCSINEDYYICQFPETVDLTAKGQLKVISEREGQQGMEVSYPLPLRLEPPPAAVKKDGHESHH